MDDDYLAFKAALGDNDLRAIGRILSSRIRSVAWDMFGEPELTKPKALSLFFEDVMRRTGESTRGHAGDYANSLVKKWGRGNNSLVIASYFYLHTKRTGRFTASEVDKLVFDGQTYEQRFGTDVPGGCSHSEALDSTSTARELLDIARLSLPISEKVLATVERLAANYGNGGKRASYELLLSLAREFDETYPGEDSEAMRKYLSAKISEWRFQHTRLLEIEAADEDDRHLLMKARNSTDVGDFTSADKFIAAVELRADNRVIADIRSKCQLLSLRASNWALANDHLKAASLFEKAADLMRHFDPQGSIAHEHNSANSYYLRAHYHTDASLAEAADRFRGSWIAWPRSLRSHLSKELVLC